MPASVPNLVLSLSFSHLMHDDIESYVCIHLLWCLVKLSTLLFAILVIIQYSNFELASCFNYYFCQLTRVIPFCSFLPPRVVLLKIVAQIWLTRTHVKDQKSTKAKCGFSPILEKKREWYIWLNRIGPKDPIGVSLFALLGFILDTVILLLA